MNCPYCQFTFKLLAVSGAEGVPDVAPLICENCARISLLVNGEVRRTTPEELEQIKKSPAWRNVLEPVARLIRDTKAPPANRDATTLTDGSPVTPDHREIQADGMQKGYVVLSAAERARGFIRPVRRSYKHVGIRPVHPTRELTDTENVAHAPWKYLAFEAYPEGQGDGAAGRYWTKEMLASGCGSVTTMGLALAETYARDPKFYGGTFCCQCRTHFPVEQFVWEGTDERLGS